MQVSVWQVLWYEPAQLLELESDEECLCEMLRKTVFPNYKFRSWVTLLLFIRTIFFFFEKVSPWFVSSIINYPYLVVEKGQWYRLATGFMRCQDGIILLLHIGIYMQLQSYYEIVFGNKFIFLWIGCMIGSGLFIILINVIGNPLLAELGIVLGIFFACSLIRWQKDVEEPGTRKLNFFILIIFNGIALVFSLIFEPGERYYMMGSYLSAVLLTFLLGLQGDDILNSFRRQAKVASGLLLISFLLGTSLQIYSGILP